MVELKACPFCGGVAAPCAGNVCDIWMACQQCSAEGPYRDTEAEAIAAWNTRPATTDVGSLDDYDIAVCATEHADKVLRASGSALKNYSMPAVKKAILSAMLDAIEEAYRAGSAKAEGHYRPAHATLQSRVDALEAENARLRGLTRYVRHMPVCSFWGYGDRPSCTCGLSAARTGAAT